MAGFQQAANAITGAYGTVAGRVGIYNELVGKNQKLIKELGSKNEELEKKNKEIADQYEALKQRTESEAKADVEGQKEYEKAMDKKEHEEFKKKLEIRKGAKAERLFDIQLAHASKNMMINALYGDFASGSGGGI